VTPRLYYLVLLKGTSISSVQKARVICFDCLPYRRLVRTLLSMGASNTIYSEPYVTGDKERGQEAARLTCGKAALSSQARANAETP